MKQINSLSPEKYLENKEYFDKGLIASLENQWKQNQNLKERIDILEGCRQRDMKTIKTLRLKCSDLSVQVYNLKTKDKDTCTEIDQLGHEIQKVYEILNEEIDSRDKTITELLKIIEEQQSELNDYKRKEKKNRLADSTNTNNPTSAYRFDDAVKDEGKKKINSRTKSGKKRGGQPGHKNTRTVLTDDHDEVIQFKVKAVPTGAEPVYDEAGNIKYYRVQVIDGEFTTRVKEVRMTISEDGIDLSEETMKSFRINPMTYSPHLKAQVLYLQSRGVVSLNRLCTIMNELSMGKLSITEGTVVNWMKEFDICSEAYRSNILKQILSTWLVHVDETGYKINGKQSWLHVLCTGNNAYFVMTEKRKDEESGPLKLLEFFENVLMHDHYKAYYDLLKCIHAECNVHILRYLQAGVDFDEIMECQKMIDHLKNLLARKYELVEAGITEISEEEYEEAKRKYLEIIDDALEKYEPKYKDIPAKYVPDAIKTLRRMKEYVDEHLLFLKDFDVEFTNNAAERQCRAAKAHKKISGQCYSIETAKYLTSLMTVIQTSSLQKTNTLQIMTDLMSGQSEAAPNNNTNTFSA